MLTLMFFAGLLLQTAPAPSTAWQNSLDAGKRAYAKHAYREAAASLDAAATAAAEDPAAEPGMLDALRLLAAVHREAGDHAQAEAALQKAAARCGERDPNGLALAAVLEEIAATQRAQGHGEAALATIDRAVEIRESHPESPRMELARDLTTAAVLRQQAGDVAKAVDGLVRALAEWDNAAPADPQALTAMEALAAIYRDTSKYAEAEPLLLRALRLREAVDGPDAAEVISTVDSLAYVEFGLKNFPEAETLYRRLLALWEKNAGPEHPMTALTHDKMAEFFAAQERYSAAEESAARALAARTNLHLASLNQTGRMLLMGAKLHKAEDIYHRAIEIGDLSQAPDEAMDPILRIYATILTTLDRAAEAQEVNARIKAALLRKADREGRRPSPVKAPAR